MSYDFSFDKKSVVFIAGGCVAIGLLLFFAGFILGWDRGTYEGRLESREQPSTVDAQKLAPPTPGKTAPGESMPAKPSPQQEAAASATKSQTPPPAGTQTNGQAADTKTNQSGAPENSAAKPMQAEAGAPKPAAAESSGNTESDPTGFSLQVGAFQSVDNALRCQSSLKSRGYSVFMFHTQDAGGRPWHTVRLGHYADIKKASEAAVAFTGKEKIPVFIRPVNEL